MKYDSSTFNRFFSDLKYNFNGKDNSIEQLKKAFEKAYYENKNVKSNGGETQYAFYSDEAIKNLKDYAMKNNDTWMLSEINKIENYKTIADFELSNNGIPKKIYANTGLVLGKVGRWRFEIADNIRYIENKLPINDGVYDLNDIIEKDGFILK